MMEEPIHVGIHPVEFAELVALMNAFPVNEVRDVQARFATIQEDERGMREGLRELDAACAVLLRDVQNATRRRDAMSQLDPRAKREEFEALRAVALETGLVTVVAVVTRTLCDVLQMMRDLQGRDVPGALVFPRGFVPGEDENEDENGLVQRLLGLLTENPVAMEAILRMNQGALSEFATWNWHVETAPNVLARSLEVALDMVERYFERLQRRHSTEGYRIHGDPVLTDVAVTILDHVDRHGEIKDGENAETVSAYTQHQGLTLARAVKMGMLARILTRPSELFGNIRKTYDALWTITEALRGATHATRTRLRRVLRRAPVETVTKEAFQRALHLLDVMDLHTIRYRPTDALLSREERAARDFRDATLEGIVALLQDPAASAEDVVRYVLGRKQGDRERVESQTQFYRCRISGGNPFLRDAPGELEVYPAEPPAVDLDAIRGSGYADVRDFLGTAARAERYRALFDATHPASNAPKSNALLLGPPGCGKTEFLRGIAGRADAIGIYASGSDFQTCWLGEASKNPKRLFEAAARLARKADRPVVILIDEIDEPLGERADTTTSRGGVNLVPEFLQLLDGLVDYPQVSLWGATNHPERMSTRMIRRFQHVTLVGELDVHDRVALLQNFFRHLPSDLREDDWRQVAERLDGAVGDVLRKVAEAVWRTLLTTFVDAKPDVAARLDAGLREKGLVFRASDLSTMRRDLLKGALANHVTLTADGLHLAVRDALRNPALRQEIAEARDAYHRHRAFLASL